MSSMDIRGEQTSVPVPGGGTRARWSWDMRFRGTWRILPPILPLLGRRIEERVWRDIKRYLDERAPLRQ
jgi:hypothetical protein